MIHVCTCCSQHVSWNPFASSPKQGDCPGFHQIQWNKRSFWRSQGHITLCVCRERPFGNRCLYHSKMLALGTHNILQNLPMFCDGIWPLWHLFCDYFPYDSYFAEVLSICTQNSPKFWGSANMCMIIDSLSVQLIPLLRLSYCCHRSITSWKAFVNGKISGTINKAEASKH